MRGTFNYILVFVCQVFSLEDGLEPKILPFLGSVLVPVIFIGNYE